MEKRVLKKPTLVLMAGLPGVGKTTLANRLGEALEWYVLDRDTLKDSWQEDELLRKEIPETMAGRAAYESFFKVAEDMLVHQHLSVILDSSSLYPFITERAIKLAEQAGAHLKVIHCIIDEETRHHRLSTRPVRKSQERSILIPAEAGQHIEQNLKDSPGHVLRLRTEEGKLEKYLETALTYVKQTSTPRVIRRKSSSVSSKGVIQHMLSRMHVHDVHVPDINSVLL